MPVYLRAFYRFFRRFSCCRATFSAINSELGQDVPALEAASHLLGAGVARSGLTCGILIGSLMSSGVSLYGRYMDDGKLAWIEAAKKIADNFKKISKNRLTCNELVGVNFSKRFGFWSYIFSVRWLICAPLAAKQSRYATKVIKEYLANSQSAEVESLYCGERVIENSELGVDIKNSARAAVSTLACGCASTGQLCGALAAKILVAGVESIGNKLGIVKAVSSELFDPEVLYEHSREVLGEFVSRFGSPFCASILCRNCSYDELNKILSQPPCSLIVS